MKKTLLTLVMLICLVIALSVLYSESYFFKKRTEAAFCIENSKDDVIFCDKKNSSKNFSNYVKFQQNNQKDNKTFVDSRDGHIYEIVQIDSQVWMAENLVFRVDSTCWFYDDDSSNVKKYGYLYDWKTALNVCPSGWHLPTKGEFETLLDNYGGGQNLSNENYEALIIGGVSGFSAFSGGWRSQHGRFGYLEEYGFYWSASIRKQDYAWSLYIDNVDKKIGITGYNLRNWGFSVRCIQDN